MGSAGAVLADQHVHQPLHLPLHAMNTAPHASENQTRYREALRAAVALLDEAEAAGEPARLSQALAEVARCHHDAGALSEADWYARRGLAVARGLGAADASVDALCTLAELSLERAQRLDGQDEPRGAHRLRDAARDHAFEATHLAQRAADSQWEAMVLLRVSDLFDRLGDHDDAIALQCRALGLISGSEAPLRIDAAPRRSHA
jgi:hypothetical protein